MDTSLVRRYTHGNFSALPTLSPERDFIIGTPARQRELISLAESQVALQREMVDEIRSSGVEAAEAICAELQSQTRALEAAIAAGAQRVVSAIDVLGDRLVGELTAVRWELAQLNDTASQMLEVLKRPRSTEARELIQQGVRNLVNDKLEQAENRFLLALDLDNTDYQTLMNLSVVELRKGDGEKALSYAHDALTLPKDLDSAARAEALWHLARLHYATEQYQRTWQCARESLSSRHQPRREFQAGAYAVLAGDIETGLAMVERAVVQQPDLFAVAAAAPDLRDCRQDVLRILTLLIEDQRASVQGLLRKLRSAAESIGPLEPDLEKLRQRLQSLCRSLEARSADGTYSWCCHVRSLLTELARVPDRLRSAGRALETLEQPQASRVDNLFSSFGRLLTANPAATATAVGIGTFVFIILIANVVLDTGPMLRSCGTCLYPLLAIGAGVLAFYVLGNVAFPLAMRSIESEQLARSHAEEVRTSVAAERREIEKLLSKAASC